MKKTLLILLASAGLACAELSPEDFNQLRSVVNSDGTYFAGVSRIGSRWLYRFNDAKNEPIAFIPFEVANLEQARAAFLASMGTMILCKQQWKRPLDEVVRSRFGPDWVLEWSE